MSEEKTEKPTPKKRKENRKEGQVPRTQEIGSWSAMLLFALALPTLASHELDAQRTLMARTLSSVQNPTVPVALELLGEGLMHVLWTLVLLGLGVMLLGVAGALSQGGFYLATKSLKPKLAKLDPIKGAKRIFGLQAMWEGAKMLLKVSVVAWMGFLAVKGLMPLLGGLVPMDTVLGAVTDDVLRLLRNAGIAGVVMGLADYAFQRRKVGKQTRMTKDEVKREHKQSEGDPLLKGAIRSRQLAASRNRMIADVATADVVLVNPTHVAIALVYEPERGAPRVVARGAGAIALRIREAATEARVPLVRDVPLARALYTSTRVGQEIPAELYAAVATVLAFVIGRRKLGSHGGEHRTPRKTEALPEVLPAGRRRPKPSASATAGR
ncbi:EscU/YscU/HrcU family type III secretion system export apparatus switch protein [Nocardioides ferulae]|uniref:EscU/YscU/HrcU family type III secretion system export apparatus switch protein n=1 Tax=Nocardioides ferulae TaxID=2340821 RepID=UPI000EB3A8AE|nr:EscU/YscU/HrcU family type III secretion system export apparatus switch protein [Nocardioides ferulae]